MAISERVKNALEGASWVRRMFEQGEELKKLHGEENVFDFSLGNPNLEPPASLKKALKALADEPIAGMHRYMPNNGYVETRKAIAQYLTEESGLPFEEKHVVMTVGAAGGLNVVFKALLDEGDEVIVPSPYFMEFKFYIENSGGRIRLVETKDDFSLNLKEIEKAFGKKTKAVLINSPNNPTGVIYNRESLEALGRMLKEKSRELKRTLYLITDEAYRRIVFDKVKLPIAFQYYPHTIRVTSHSKDLSLPGERIGYIAINPSIEDIDELIAAIVFANRTLGFVNAPALMQRLVAPLQRNSVNIREYEEKRDLFYNSLSSYGYQIVKPEGAFYLFPKTLIEDDVAFVKELQAKRILVVPGRGFGKPGYFRIAYAVDMRTIEKSLPGFKEVAEKLGTGK
ncbi:MAG: pyridoxal phosphate-dependent aminotransferase [Deltaproteobacteria bacterium]|nr:pyridoxal phosphate-dependent aminotransferase [Deltaproteobacteria bacterium]MBM4348016.1 pyridoxal phosphate-dependent aminotransferase [Deltaproteobacteria bacterium]